MFIEKCKAMPLKEFCLFTHAHVFSQLGYKNRLVIFVTFLELKSHVISDIFLGNYKLKMYVCM